MYQVTDYVEEPDRIWISESVRNTPGELVPKTEFFFLSHFGQ